MLGFDALGALALGGSPDGAVTLSIGLATETDSALARIFDYPLEIAEETDTALAVGRAVILGLATETDSALAATALRTLGFPVETDEALHLAVPIGLLIETDTALSLRPVRAYAIGQATETDSVLTLTLVDGIAEAIGLATETDSALSVLIRNMIMAEETDEALVVLPQQVSYWPFDDLKPRHIGIYPCANPIGGGVSIVDREPTINSGHGYWRIAYGGVYVKTRAQVYKYRQLEGYLEGRGRAIVIYLFDGKRAPWPSTPGGSITGTASASVAAEATSIQIDATDLATLRVGMGFSTTTHRYYRIKAITGTVGDVYTCTIFPPVREAIASGDLLEFGMPTLLARLEDDSGMALPLELLRHGDGNVIFVEDVP